MKFTEWMITAAIAILGGVAAFSAARTTLSHHETRIINIETWKDATIDALGRMDTKLDLLLEANGVKYKKK